MEPLSRTEKSHGNCLKSAKAEIAAKAVLMGGRSNIGNLEQSEPPTLGARGRGRAWGAGGEGGWDSSCSLQVGLPGSNIFTLYVSLL